MPYERVDFLDEIGNAGERTTADGALGNEPEPAFDLVEPGGIRGDVVHVIAGPLRQPSAHLGMFVGGIVVDDQVEFEFWRHRPVQVTQEREELLMAVPRLTFREHSAGGDIQSREQSGGAMADIVMSHAFDVTQAHRQHGLGAVQGLNLAFFIDAEHQSVIRRVQVEADDVAHLLR